MTVLFPDEMPTGEVEVPKEPRERLNVEVEGPPRKVSLGLPGRMAAAALAAVFAAFAWSCVPIIRGGARSDSVDLLFFTGMLVIAMPIALRATFRAFWERKLLRSGACSVGRVTSLLKTGGWSRRKNIVFFEFPVGGHKPMMGRGTDWTRNYKENKPVVVFYDPEDISRYVAFCSTGWRVRTRAGPVLEP